MVKIAVIGCGMVAEEMHLPAFTSIPGASVTALVDVDPKALNRMGDRYGVKARYADYRRMLRKEPVDAVSVCTPNYLHAQMTVDCCRAGKYVLVEKPAATSLAEIQRMKAAADKAGVFVMVEQYHRFVATNERARSVVQSGILGKVTGFHACLRAGGPARWAPDSKWFWKKSQAFGGALADLGIHIIDTVRWITGKEIRSVQCVTSKIGRRGDVEDNAVLTATTADGLVGTVDVSWTQVPGRLAIEVYCENGLLETVGYKFLRATMTEPRAEVTFDVPKESPTGGPFKYFVECVRTGRRPFVDIVEGGRSLAVVIAAYDSAASGGTARVRY